MAKPPTPTTSVAPPSATPPGAAAPVQLVPRVTFSPGFLAYDRVTRIKPGGTLNWNDPQHQKIMIWAFSHVLGAAVDFVPVSQTTLANDMIASRDSASAVIAKSQAALDGFEKIRLAEIVSLNADLKSCTDQIDTSSLSAPGDTPDKQRAAFLATDEGIALKAKQSGIEARIKQVEGLIAAAKAGTDGTLQVSMANNELAAAKKALAALSPSPVVAAPAAPSAGPTSPAGAAAT